jgi:hypothetical protein
LAESQVESKIDYLRALGNRVLPEVLQFAAHQQQGAVIKRKGDLARMVVVFPDDKVARFAKIGRRMTGFTPSCFSSSACQASWSVPSRYQFRRTLLNSAPANRSISRFRRRRRTSQHQRKTASVNDIAGHFTSRGAWKKRIEPLLTLLVALGRASEKEGLYRAH